MAVALPDDFISRVAADPFLGSGLLEALDTDAPVTVRMNPSKVLAPLEIKEKVSWCEQAYYLETRPSFTLDPLFHAGAYYPQEAGSMLLDYVLRSLDLPDEPHILDLCAAPGGKSTLIATFLNGKGMLVSNEIVPQRAHILRENLVKWGSVNTIVTNNKPADFSRLPHLFDVLVVDAPCSGEGMFRKDIDARSEWSMANVLHCAERQQTILSDVWDTLRPGGFLVYSTCTFNRTENEDTVQWIMEEFGAEILSLSWPESVKADREGLGCYCLPGIAETEGFYLAVLQKPESASKKIHTTSRLRNIKDTKELTSWIRLEDHFQFYQREEWFYAIPKMIEQPMLQVQATLRLLKFGVTIGTMARKGIIPSEELALSPDMRSPELPRISLDKEKALAYLKGDTFPVEGPDGWNLVAYQDEPLGWIKKIGNRFNNQYPKEWRIRMRIDR
jgi:16S rRNA C967 or C1407 C5-methylase (RsmB/RsmF family)/NOL1/NOP2/fmu family ribosome biogenesis protein